MFSKEELNEIVKQKVESDENLGYKAGGSGHLGYIGYKINDVVADQLSNGEIKISYKYILFVETEFTMYPDNPPQEYPKSKTIIINKNKKIIREE